MVISVAGRKRLASSPVGPPASSPTKYSRLGSVGSAYADRSRSPEANNAVDCAASNDGASIVAVSDAESALGGEDTEVTMKSGHWISQLTLRNVLSGSQFGVAEHQALAHLKELQANSVK